MLSKTRACGPETHGGLWQINSGPVIVCVRSDLMTILVLTTLLIFLTPGIGWRFYCVCESGANDSPYHLDVSKNVFVFVTVFVTIVLFMFQALMALLITWTSQNVSSNQQISQQSLGSHGDGWS